MKVFVFEFVTGGGFAGKALPEFLPDGEVIWQALVGDLSAIAGVEVLTLRDSRLPHPGMNKVQIITTEASRFEEDYQYCLAMSDAVWPVAPEEAGILESLNLGVLNAGKRLLGCQPEAVRIASSKFATAQQLSRAGIEIAPTYTSPYLMAAKGPVVAKPDDGAGCQDTLYFSNLTAAEEWTLAQGGTGFVFQHFLSGDNLSLSLLCHEKNSSQLLSVNRQHISLENGRLRFHGVVINALPDPDGRYADLAQQVVSAIPGLWGYVGIDLIETEDGPVILEVNPRATVSYAGLRSVLSFNPAEKVLSLPDSQPLRNLLPASSINCTNFSLLL
ncbi:MAG: ATP-grasp domain-containing protein [Thiobacillus sp.]|nr:ATP-grasp domain-containing protein [Thiobacillus sp.]